jgi:hypothetical protein
MVDMERFNHSRKAAAEVRCLPQVRDTGMLLLLLLPAPPPLLLLLLPAPLLPLLQLLLTLLLPMAAGLLPTWMLSVLDTLLLLGLVGAVNC